MTRMKLTKMFRKIRVSTAYPTTLLKSASVVMSVKANMSIMMMKMML